MWSWIHYLLSGEENLFLFECDSEATHQMKCHSHCSLNITQSGSLTYINCDEWNEKCSIINSSIINNKTAALIFFLYFFIRLPIRAFYFLWKHLLMNSVWPCCHGKRFSSHVSQKVYFFSSARNHALEMAFINSWMCRYMCSVQTSVLHRCVLSGLSRSSNPNIFKAWHLLV